MANSENENKEVETTTPEKIETTEVTDTTKEVAQKRAADEAEENNEPVKKQKVDDEPSNNLEQKIIRQIEYYFGDANLSRDKFMLSKISEDDGWIPLTVMTTFKRLANLTTDHDVIINALRKSETQLVQVSEDKTKIRRAPECPIPEFNEERKKEVMSRTAYVKGFPLTAEIDDILKWFEDKTNVESVNKRHYLDKATKTYKFKGSVFTTFKSVDDCKKFVESGPYHYDTDKVEMIVKWQQVYLEDKKKERQDAKELQGKMKKDVETTKFDDKLMKDCSILHLTNLKPETVREDIKSKLVETSDVDIRYIDFNKNDTDAYVRLAGSDSGKKLLEKITDNKIEINGVDVPIRILENDEFDQYIEKIKTEIIAKKKHMQNKKQKRGRGKNRNGKK